MNIYVPNIRVPKYIKHILPHLEREIDYIQYSKGV